MKENFKIFQIILLILLLLRIAFNINDVINFSTRISYVLYLFLSIIIFFYILSFLGVLLKRKWGFISVIGLAIIDIVGSLFLFNNQLTLTISILYDTVLIILALKGILYFISSKNKSNVDTGGGKISKKGRLITITPILLSILIILFLNLGILWNTIIGFFCGVFMAVLDIYFKKKLKSN